jgi:lactoylglutathione lyase
MDASSAVEELRVAVTVEDIDEALAFWQETVGLPVVQQWDTPGGRGVILGAERATLELIDPMQAETIDAVEVGRRVSGVVRLAVQVRRVDAVAARLQSRGGSLIGAPVDTPWGDRNARFEAPGGLQLTLFEVAE